MARTAFHRKLSTLTTSSPMDVQAIIKAFDAGNGELKGELGLKIDGIVTATASSVEANLKPHLGALLEAIGKRELPDLGLSEDIRDPLSGLALIEAMILDKKPVTAQNNKVLHSQSIGRRMTERKKALTGADPGLPTDYANAFRDFRTGDEAERAARLREVIGLRERVLRHFALQHAAAAHK